VVAFLGKGNGVFVQKQFVAGTSFDYYLALDTGDINEDGCPDIVFSDSFALAFTYSGHCDGTFTQAASLRLGDVGISLTLHDVNGDGHLDVVSGSVLNPNAFEDSGGNLLSVLRGDGQGNFAPGSVFRGEPTLAGIAIADLNNDGHPDVISANQDADSGSIFLNNSSGDFGPPSGYAIGFTSGSMNSTDSAAMQADLDT
jgi:VCBS repeat protein